MTIGDELGSAASRHVEFAGFWRRIGAVFIDGLLLAALGWAIGLVFYDQLVAMGQFARVIGFVIEFAYLSFFNSKLGDGATLGKRALGLQVVARDGGHISLGRSLLRSAILMLPFYLNGFDLSFLTLTATAMSVVLVIDLLVVFGVMGASIYLYLANWRTRQVMHDLAAGTFVIKGNTAPVDRHIAKIHVVVIAIWLALAASIVPLEAQFGSPALKAWFGNLFDANYDSLLAIQAAVNTQPDVLSNGVSVSSNTFRMSGQKAETTTFLFVAADLKQRTDDTDSAADRIAAMVLSKQPDILNRDKLSVTVSYGYSLGIWSMWNQHTYAFTPGEWKARIQQRAKTRPNAI